MSSKWIAARPQIVEAVERAVGLWQGDLVIDEVATAENKSEALSRLKTVIADCKRAIAVVKRVKL